MESHHLKKQPYRLAVEAEVPWVRGFGIRKEDVYWKMLEVRETEHRWEAEGVPWVEGVRKSQAPD
jgi:hypothetical protein